MHHRLNGMAFMRAGAAASGKDVLEDADFIALLGAAIEGIQQRGKAQKGEKTMLDAPDPGLRGVQVRTGFGGRSGTRLGESPGCGARRSGVHQDDRRHEGPRQLSRRAQPGASGPGCDLRHADAGSVVRVSQALIQSRSVRINSRSNQSLGPT